MSKILVSALAAVAMALSSAAFADPPPWAGGGGKGKGKGKGHHSERDSRAEHRRHFVDDHRVYVHEYYHEEFRRGKCPPGLAKKNNGCMPPGQAKKWHVGQPIPKSVVYYEIPPAIIVQLPPPRSGHQYVRVASDILLIAVGSGMVIDAIQDLGRM